MLSSKFIRQPALIAVLAALAVIIAYQSVSEYRVDIGQNDHPYVRDFHSLEYDDAQTIMWRWSKARSEIVFHNAGQILPSQHEVTLELTLASARPPDIAPPKVELTLQGRAQQRIATFYPSSDISTYRFLIDSSLAGAGDWGLEIASQTFRPEGDDRQLGVSVLGAALRAADTKLPIWPPFPTSLYAILMPPLLFLAVWGLLDGARLDRYGSVLSLGVGIIATLIIGLGLISYREQTTYYLPFLCAILLVVGVWQYALRVAANPPGRKLIAFFTGRWLDRVGLTVGLLLLVIGEALVWLADENTIKAGSALLASGAIVTFVFIGLRQQERREIGLAAPTRTEWLILSVITLLALAMRVYRLDEVLYGLFRDEARFGLLGLRVLDDPTYHPIYEGPPIHQSGFYLYLLAIAFRLLGASIFSLRLVSAVAGALLVPVVWWMAREWFRDARVALVAAFGLAISAMHVSNSRFAVPYVESTLLSIPAYVFLTRGFEGGRLRDYALAGFFFGVTQYTSQISRVALVFGAILVLDEIITRHAWPPNLLRGAFVLVVVALLVLTPLLSFIVQNPAAYFARTTQVYALNPDYTWGEYPLTVLWNNVLAYAGMFNVTGNSLGGRILPAYPELDPVFGVLLLVGLAGTLTRLQESAHRRVVLWFMTALLTGLITVDAPNPLRVLEVTAPTFILTGLAFVSLKDIFNSLTSSKLRTRAFACATLTLMFAALAVNYAVYFIDKGGDPRIWSRNQVFGSMIGHTLNQWRSQNLIASDTIVYAPDWFVEQHNEQDAFNFTTNSQFKLLPFSKYSGYFSPHIMIVRPNELGDWELLSERAPFYKAFGKQVIEGDNQDQAQVQSLLGDRAALELRGPNFPQSDKPTFWAYVLE